VALALELLMQFPAAMWSARVVVMADAGYGSTEFIQGCKDLGFSRLLVGVRCDPKLSDKRRLDQLKKRGQAHQLHDFKQTLWVTWCDVKRDQKKKRFFLLSTFKAAGAYLAKRYRQRCLIESLFKSIKHDFGLKEARLSTKGGIKLWIFFACLAYSFASLERFLADNAISFCHAANRVLESLTDIVLLYLMLDCERFNLLDIHHQHRVKLVFV